MSFKAEVICASKNTHGQRITTFLITFPRFILAELNTHRMLSKNSASSRAIPFKKMLKMVRENPFIPLRWMKEHTGMQGTEYFKEDERFGGEGTVLIIPHLLKRWLWLRDIVCQEAEALNNSGVFYDPDGTGTKLTGDGRGLSKQICNRLLEPFAWHTVLITGTEWENFFALRANPAAEIHMAHLAELMLEAYNNAEVKQLQPGEWHMPYGDRGIPEQFISLAQEFKLTEIDLRLKAATARCAQTSYTLLGDDEKPMDYPKLFVLHDRLAKSGHWSPFEHCARAMSGAEYELNIRGKLNEDTQCGYPLPTEESEGWCGNFRGFIQYRKLFENENQSDSRVKH